MLSICYHILSSLHAADTTGAQICDLAARGNEQCSIKVGLQGHQTGETETGRLAPRPACLSGSTGRLRICIWRFCGALLSVVQIWQLVSKELVFDGSQFVQGISKAQYLECAKEQLGADEQPRSGQGVLLQAYRGSVCTGKLLLTHLYWPWLRLQLSWPRVYGL